jgi:hypothetical protein
MHRSRATCRRWREHARRGACSAAHVVAASDRLGYFDKTTFSGYFEARVSRCAAPDAKGRYAAPQVYPATVLFERPDRFRFAINPGAKNEYRAVASNGIVQWLGSGHWHVRARPGPRDVVDPLASALLGSVGELIRYGTSKDIPLAKQNSLFANAGDAAGVGIAGVAGIRILRREWPPSGFEFAMQDGSRVFIALSYFKQNVKDLAQDFQL